MTLFNKVKWILGILVVFLIILSTNLIDRNNFETVKNSVVNIYEDRLVVKGALYDMADLLHKKEIAYLKRDTAFFIENNTSINESLDGLTLIFSEARLTHNEKKALDKFIMNLDKLKKLEGFLKPQTIDSDDVWIKQMEETKIYLNELSKIQITEGSKQFWVSKKAMDAVELYTQMEIYFLIFLALLIQFIVIYSPSKKKEEED